MGTDIQRGKANCLVETEHWDVSTDSAQSKGINNDNGALFPPEKYLLTVSFLAS